MEATNSHDRPRIEPLFIAVSVVPVAVVGAMFLYLSYPPTVLLGAIPPVAVILFIGSTRVSYSDDESMADGRRANANRAGNSALMILLGTITIDGFLNLIPPGGKSVVYLAVGGMSLLILYLYHNRN